MKRSILFLSALACALVPTLAHGDTVTFASGPGTTYTYVSAQGALNGTGGLAVAYQNAAYAGPIAGSQWVSTSATGGNGNAGNTDYSVTFNLLANELYSGTLAFMADDLGQVYVNGSLVSNTYGGFYGPATINLLPSFFTSGLNTVTVREINLGAQAAVDFAGSLNGTAVTPEPSSLVLLGTGVLGAAGIMRRRFQQTV